MSYFEEMNKDFLVNIAKRQELKTDPDYWFGEFLATPEDFFEDVYRTYLEEKNRRTFLVGKEFKTQFKCDHIDKVLEKYNNFQFFTPSIFWHHRVRTKDELIWITQITLDFDLTRDGSGRKYDHHMLMQVLFNEFGYTPNYVWTSRTEGNLQACYLINPMTGTPQSIYYFESIVRRMAVLVGADVTATTAVNLYCIPKKGVWKFTDKIYDIDDFSIVLEDDEIEDALTSKRAKNVVSFTEAQIMKHESIQALLNADFLQYRNHAAFTIALLYYSLGKTSEEAEDFLNGEWFDKVNDGRIYSPKGKFRRREVKSVVKSAFSGKYHGPSKEWIYLITGVEFPYNLYKSSYIKKGVYQTANEIQLKILKWLEKNDNKKVKKSVICKELSIPEKSFRRNLEEMKNNNLIEYESKTGPNGGYIIQDKRRKRTSFEIENDTNVNLLNIIDYFEEKHA